MAKIQKVINGELVEIDEDENIIQDPVEEQEEEQEDQEDQENQEPELDEDGNPIVEKPKVEPWQQEDEDGVPISTHIHMKKKLKGRVSERDDKISILEQEIENLKKGKTPPTNVVDLPKRPKRDEFESDDEYYAAIDLYEDQREDIRLKRMQQDKEVKERQAKALQALTQTVDAHYERAGKLIEESKIDPKVYKDADTVVRSAIEAIRPKEGDIIVDQLISLTGEGSEKVMYFLGRNKTALTELKSLLAEDPAGMKAAIFLGQQKERLLNPKTRTSSAPPPTKNIRGDKSVSESKKVSDLKKKYKKAHKDGNSQAAFNLKREAKLAGADTSTWTNEV